MTKYKIAATVAALISLSGCNPMSVFGGDQANGNATADTNQSGGESATAANAAAAADAGVTSSRSLAGLIGGDGGKDPGGAIPASSSSNAVFNRQDLLGRWADDEACKTEIDLRPDGSFTSFDGGQGNWTLNGDMLTLTGGGGSFALRIQSIEGGLMTVVNPNGQIGRSRRC